MDFFSLMFAPLSHWGILLSGTIIFFLLGWFWYSPMSPTGKIWGKHFSAPKKAPPPSQMAVMLGLQFFMGFIYSHTVMVLWLFLTGTGMGATLSSLFIIKMYMGFVFIKDIGHWYFEKKPFSLVLIGVGYYLVGVIGVCLLLSYFG